MGYWSFHAENFASTFILLNRLSSICIPVKHVKIWRQYLVPLSIALTLVIPTIICHRMFWLEVFIRTQSDNSTYTLDTRGRDASDANGGNYNACLSGVIFLFVCAFLNIATVIAYRQHRKQFGGSWTEASDSDCVEIKLTVYALATFIAQLLMCAYNILVYYCIIVGTSSTYVFLTTFNQAAWINDLSTVAMPAWMLLWASSHIRNLMAITFFKSSFFGQLWKSTNGAMSSKRNSDSRGRTLALNSVDIRINQSIGHKRSIPFGNSQCY
ncbi:srg family chemoreceptor domain-containing protein [Ditylenchus destructor]|nr:srg family chemoreceptor domain-containing protein [Ditylenchus destructor]